jgi:hypothetical protein
VPAERVSMRKTHEVLRLHFDLKLTKAAPDRPQCESEPEYGTRISASVHGGGFVLAASGADVRSEIAWSVDSPLVLSKAKSR